jgi:hypothetical protein
MPTSIVQGILETLLQPVFEAGCYFVGKIVVPIFSLGRIKCEQLAASNPRKNKTWSGLFRRNNGQIFLTPEATAGVGLLFIVLVAGAVGLYFYFRS